MAYPTGMLSLTLEKVDLQVIHLRRFCVAEITAMAAGDVSADRILLRVYGELTGAHTQLTAAKNAPGIAQYAKDQKADQVLDVVAEFNALLSAIQSAIDWVITNFPAAGGYVQARTLTAGDPIPQQRQFSPAQTADLRTALQGVVDSITIA